jgi:hypothetical protein
MLISTRNLRNLYSRLRYIVTLAIGLGVAVSHVSAADTDADGRLYQPSANPVANVQQVLPN